MSSPLSDHPPKRQRTVEGSCWACKQRRVKCDLQKPACRRCQVSGTECCYDKVLLRWDARRSRTSTVQPHTPGPLTIGPLSFQTPLAVPEKKALDYFRGRLWPLLSTSADPCQPPIAIALQSQPVLEAACIFAEAHRALRDREPSNQSLINRRVKCLAGIRGSLVDPATSKAALHALLLAVLLLYHSDGFVDCLQPHTSTQSHHAGVVAIVRSLGGFDRVFTGAGKEISMLLSEFATTDVITAMLRGHQPSVSHAIWDNIESGPVWWETGQRGTVTFASVFGVMTELACYAYDISQGNNPIVNRVDHFERVLQPSYPSLGKFASTDMSDPYEDATSRKAAIYSHALCRAFQHAAMIFLYRAVCFLPTQHFLVQQHVHACLACITSMEMDSKSHNCTVFPLYVVGAHALDPACRATVLSRIDAVEEGLGFESVIAIRQALEQLWQSDQQSAGWLDTFNNLPQGTLVL
ncbi:hypothetical protein Q7P37_006581 [Cladosporium fusiforme]